MWSLRPFNPRCAAVPGERTAEAMAARLNAAAVRCPRALRGELKRFSGRLAAVLTPSDGLRIGQLVHYNRSAADITDALQLKSSAVCRSQLRLRALPHPR